MAIGVMRMTSVHFEWALAMVKKVNPLKGPAKSKCRQNQGTRVKARCTLKEVLLHFMHIYHRHSHMISMSMYGHHISLGLLFYTAALRMTSIRLIQNASPEGLWNDHSVSP